MYALWRLIWQIMLLRKGPQDLPYSPTLFGLAFVAAGVLEFINLLLPSVKDKSIAIDEAVVYILTHNVIALLVLYLILYLMRYPARAVQTLSAVFFVQAGLYAIHFVIFAIGYLLTPLGPLVLILAIVLLIWSLLIDAHIFRHALSISFPVAGILAVSFFLLGMYILSQFELFKT